MRSMTCWQIYALSVLAIVAGGAHADAYMAAFDQAQWLVQRSPLTCRLTQVVPRFGEATFEAAGGGRQRFVLRAKKNPLVGGPTQLTAAAPSWNPARESIALGNVEIADGAEPLQLGAEPATQLLDTLKAGLVPMFARPLQDDTQTLASVALSPVNFRPAYRQYSECIGQLLPVTFEQVQNTVVEFPLEQSELSAAAQKKIDSLLRYAASDRSVTGFEIHGMSSDKKLRLDNLALAKQRTQQVNEYLLSRGINAKSIESSYHGERGAAARPQRFVSIRLKRSGAPSF